MPQPSKVAETISNSPKGSGPAGRYLKVAAVLRAGDALRGAMGAPVAPVDHARD
jgi:hypothetical protein